MKYSRLSKEQFEELHVEFSQFLASHSIDAAQWSQLKREKSKTIDSLLDIFSDIVWEKMLTKVTNLEYYTTQQVVFLHKDTDTLHAMIFSTNQEGIDFETLEGLEWLEKHLQTELVTMTIGEKSKDIYAELHQWIRKGSQISDGKRFKRIQTLIS